MRLRFQQEAPRTCAAVPARPDQRPGCSPSPSPARRWRAACDTTGRLLRLAALLVLTFIAACDSVNVDKPFGNKPATIDKEEWEGHWYVDGDSVFRLRVVDAAEGILELASIKDADGAPKIDASKVYLREAHGWKFMFTPAEKAGDGYAWCKYENYEGNMIILWLPAAAKFKAAIEQGLMHGEVRSDAARELEGSPLKTTKETTLLLKDIGDKEIALLASEDKGVFFDWQNPLPIRRVRE